MSYISQFVLFIVITEQAFSAVLIAVQIRLHPSPVINVVINYLSVFLLCINQ